MVALEIGKLSLDNNLVLSPMAGYTDVAMRVLCRRAGAGMVFTEMVHSTALLHRNAKTLAMTQILDEERPVCVQLFGTEPSQLATSCKELNDEFDALSVNFGCPAQQIKAAGCGAALLDKPDRIAAIVSSLRKSTEKPLIPKMRLGNSGRADYVGIARSMERAGADALIVHGRTASQGYSGKADWAAIAEIVDALSIPIIANGDVVDGKSANECLEITGAAGLAIGRAALGDPDVFRRIDVFLMDGVESEMPTDLERVRVFKEYVDQAGKAGISTSSIIQQAMQFTRGMKNGARIRGHLGSAKNVKDVLETLRKSFD